jgi:hypothetical protein
MMKPLLLMAALGIALSFVATPAIAQEADTTRSREVQKERLVDRDGDGIPDKTPGHGQRMRRGKDRFIDKDGDGICDGRAAGLGLRSRGGEGKMKGGKR